MVSAPSRLSHDSRSAPVLAIGGVLAVDALVDVTLGELSQGIGRVRRVSRVPRGDFTGD
jgi:hypothetical protein